jgi:hypothetical protein
VKYFDNRFIKRAVGGAHDSGAGKMTRKQIRFVGFLILAVGIGLVIGWIDTRPNWDDTGITVALILGSALLFGFGIPEHPWMWALAIGIWIPMFNIVQSRNFESLIAIVPAFLGSYLGYIVRRAIRAGNGSRVKMEKDPEK